MFLPILLIVIGVVVGGILSRNRRCKEGVSLLVGVLIFVLIFIMGVKIGLDRDIMTQLPRFGYVSMALAVGWIVGCSVLGWVVYKWINRGKSDEI